MGEVDVIIKEKNDQINSLKSELSELQKKTDEKLEYYKKKSEGQITKKAVAEEIYGRLKKIKFVAGIAIIGPPIAGIAASVNFLAGAVLGCFAAVAAVILSKREIFSEIERLKEKYNLK